MVRTRGGVSRSGLEDQGTEKNIGRLGGGGGGGRGGGGGVVFGCCSCAKRSGRLCIMETIPATERSRPAQQIAPQICY